MDKIKLTLTVLVVAFSVLAFTQIDLVYGDTLFEYYNTNDTGTGHIYEDHWYGQTFTPTTSHYITHVKLKMFRFGSVGNLTVGIRATNGSGVPTGSHLTSGVIDADTFTTSSPGQWYQINLTGYTLQSNIKYAIVCTAPDAVWSARVEWREDGVGSTYPRGISVYSNDNGTNWATIPGSDMMFEEYGYYGYTFHGVFDEDTGLLMSADQRAVNVTSYFIDGTSPETFEVNGTEIKSWDSTPQYFYFDLSKPREYWLSEDEQAIDIYIFDDSLTTYTITFIDLAGVLDVYPYVMAERYINGSLMTVEKRKVDLEKKVSMNLKNGGKYTIQIEQVAAGSYTFGDLTMTSTTSVTLTIKGIKFPKETLLTYKYVRIYALRAFGPSNTGNISIIYQDTLNMTNSVEIKINYKNGSNAYSNTETSDNFNHVWASAKNDTDYFAVVTIDHQKYGVYPWKQIFPRSLSSNPWEALSFLGTLPFDLGILVAAALILAAGGSFSVINAEVGAFMMVVVAIIVAWMGWIPIPASFLVVALSLTFLMAIIYAKRRVQT